MTEAAETRKENAEATDSDGERSRQIQDVK
jgi:hypothetical protein